MLKNARKSRSLLKCHSAWYPNERDGMSPSWFRFPARCRVTSGEALFFLRRIAKTRSNLFATRERLDAPLPCQATVAELSLQHPAWIHLVGTHASSTSQPSTSAAISKSELVMSPSGLSNVTSLSTTSWGHLYRHTMGANSRFPGSHTPPAASPDASSVPL